MKRKFCTEHSEEILDLGGCRECKNKEIDKLRKNNEELKDNFAECVANYAIYKKQCNDLIKELKGKVEKLEKIRWV